MEVILLRHGKTQSNLAGRYSGRTDEGLCPEGMRQVRAATPWPEVSRLYVSPMLRARQTARLLFPNAEQIPLDGLREMDFGVFEGRSPGEMARDGAYRRWLNDNCESPCPGGESRAAFSRRVCAAFDAAAGQAIQRGEPRLILVAHGGTIMAILSKYAEPARDYFSWAAANAQGWHARLDESAWARRPALTHCVYMEALRREADAPIPACAFPPAQT